MSKSLILHLCKSMKFYVRVLSTLAQIRAPVSWQYTGVIKDAVILYSLLFRKKSKLFTSICAIFKKFQFCVFELGNYPPSLLYPICGSDCNQKTGLKTISDKELSLHGVLILSQQCVPRDLLPLAKYRHWNHREGCAGFDGLFQPQARYRHPLFAGAYMIPTSGLLFIINPAFIVNSSLLFI